VREIQLKGYLMMDNQASHFFLSMFILGAVALFIATVAYIHYNELVSGTKKEIIPSVGMIQEGAHVFITGVQNGPVANDSVFVQIINKTNGKEEGYAIINAGSDNIINTGDTILLKNITRGTKYVVSMLYQGHTVGNCNYFVV
jgi:hypothetical protein